MVDLLLYTAGPITGLSYGESTDWREYVQKQLPSNFHVVSPMRGKDYLKGHDKILANYEELPLSSQAGINARDHFDVRRCHMVLLNLLGATKVSIGSMLEVGWASEIGKPIVLVMEKEGNIHSHPMLLGNVGYWVHDLDMGISIAKAVLSPTL